MNAPLPYELRIGVTGHRTITDADAATVRRTVRGLLDRIVEVLNCPVAPLEWTVVSPLARGADRVVADAALERPGAKLEVVTPFPLAQYRSDFETSEDHAAFDELLRRAGRVHELDGMPASSDRSTAYRRVGQRVVDSSELLVAVWDGRPARGAGGTADIVEYALESERIVIWIDARHPSKPPRLIRAIRFAGESFKVETAAMPRRAQALSRGYVQQAAYGEDQSFAGNVLQERLERETAQLHQAAADAGLPVGALDNLLARVLPTYIRSDSLALAYQRKHTRAVNGVLYLAACAVTVGVAQVLFFSDEEWVILFEVATMIAVLALWVTGRRTRWHQKWLHDRYIAERLRAVIFTALIEKRVPDASTDNPLPFYQGPWQWMAHLVTTVRDAALAAAPRVPLEPLKQFLIRAWLRDQQAFHTRSARKHSRRARRRHQLGFFLFGATLVMALLHMFGVGHLIEADGSRLLQPALWITFATLVLPLWAGAIHAATSQLELERIAERSRRMAFALEALVHRAARAETADALALVIDDAVRLMTMETHEWWVLLSFQDVRLHV